MSQPRPSCVPVSPQVKDWREAAPCDHFVQFYRTDEYLIECLASYVADGIWSGESVVVIVTEAHREALKRRLRLKGVSISSGDSRRRLAALDAEELLAKFVSKKGFDLKSFREAITPLIVKAGAGNTPVRAFGEMVAVLWARGEEKIALELEDAWNQLQREYDFRLFCAYPSSSVEINPKNQGFTRICAAHSRVVLLNG